MIVQWPERLGRTTPYFTMGTGLYGETTNDGRGSGEVLGHSAGGGVKLHGSGRLWLRVDYRVFFLSAPDASRNLPLRAHPQRVSGGVAVAF